MTDPHRLLVKLLVGNTSEMLPHPSPEGHTHRWTLFVRPPRGEFTDRRFINSVTFRLHESFRHPRRTVKRPPFQISETGYGGFTIPIELKFAGGVAQVYTINWDLELSLVERYKEFKLEHALSIKDPSEEMIQLSQVYCPARKASSASIASTSSKGPRERSPLINNEMNHAYARASVTTPTASNSKARVVDSLFKSMSSDSDSAAAAKERALSPEQRLAEDLMDRARRPTKHKHKHKHKHKREREREQRPKSKSPPTQPPPPPPLPKMEVPAPSDDYSLKRRLEAVRDPEVLFRCADFLVENEAERVSMEGGWLDVDLEKISLATREQLERIVSGEG